MRQGLWGTSGSQKYQLIFLGAVSVGEQSSSCNTWEKKYYSGHFLHILSASTYGREEDVVIPVSLTPGGWRWGTLPFPHKSEVIVLDMAIPVSLTQCTQKSITQDSLLHTHTHKHMHTNIHTHSNIEHTYNWQYRWVTNCRNDYFWKRKTTQRVFDFHVVFLNVQS